LSIVQVNQIKHHLKEQFDGLIDMSDSHQRGENLEKHFLTRALAAYSIKLFVEDDNETIGKLVTDGSNDNGLDAIYYNEKEQEIILVQSKWIDNGNGEPDLGEIKKFTDGVRDLISHKFHKFNKKLMTEKMKLKEH
jgi:hypothetical protein